MTEACKGLFNANSPIGDGKGAVLDDGSGVTVGVDDDTQVASIVFVKPWEKAKFSVTVSAPVSEGTGRATFVGFDGIGDTQKVKVEYSYFRWPRFSLFRLFQDSSDAFPGGELLDTFKKTQVLVCERQAVWLANAKRESEQGESWSTSLKALSEDAAKLDLPTQEQILEYYVKNAAGGLTAGAGETTAADTKVQKLIQDTDANESICQRMRVDVPYDPSMELYERGVVSKLDLTGGQSRIAMFSGNAAVGRKDFSFIDRGQAEAGVISKVSEEEAPWSVGLRMGFVYLTEELEAELAKALVLSANLERSYEPADEVDVCSPVLGELSSCESISLGDPEPVDSYVISLEYRSKMQKMAYAIRAFYRGVDSKEDDYGIELPIYFLRNTAGGFQGGIALGWRDQDDNGSVSIFVGKSFGIL